MLLDTGAPGMHISSELAEKLGIMDKDEGKLLYDKLSVYASEHAVPREWR